MSSAANVFLDFIKLESVTAKGIFDSLFDCLQSERRMQNYLKTHSFCVTCDGAAVMVGSNTGVTKLTKDFFLRNCHCANHISELSVGDRVKSVTGISKFKAFTDKVCHV